jgi:hypothetical protein
MDNGTMKDYLEDLIIKVNDASKAMEEAAVQVKQWRKIADRMYAEIVKDYCWHCGAERTRNCYTSDLMDDYREACIQSGVRND